jgi:hypothetical protein
MKNNYYFGGKRKRGVYKTARRSAITIFAAVVMAHFESYNTELQLQIHKIVL